MSDRLPEGHELDAESVGRRLDVPLATELDLLVTHGVLHLIGYDDRDPIEARLMHEREREILSAGRRRPPAGLWRGLLDSPETAPSRARRVEVLPEPKNRRARRPSRSAIR